MLEEAWEIVKVHWAVLIFAPLTVMVLVGLPSGIINQIPVKGVLNILGVRFVGLVIQVLLGAFFEVGLARVFLTAARREIPDIGTIFQGGASFARMLGVQVVVTILSLTLVAVAFGPAIVLAASEIGLDALADPTLLVSRLRHIGPNPFLAMGLGGLVLLPLSVFLTMRLSFAAYYIADTDRGSFEALGASWTALRGNMLGLFGYLILVFLLSMAGLLMCCVGILPVLAVTRLGLAIIYTRVSGRVGSAARV